MDDSQVNPDSDVTSLKDEVRESQSRIRKGLLISVGWISLVLGVLGIVLPVLPTTPFLLLSAACFAKSSERFYVMLLTNRYFGPYIRDWRANRGLTIKTKLWVIFVMGFTMSISAYFAPLMAIRIMLAVIGIGVSIFILQLPTKRSDLPDDDVE